MSVNKVSAAPNRQYVSTVTGEIKNSIPANIYTYQDNACFRIKAKLMDMVSARYNAKTKKYNCGVLKNSALSIDRSNFKNGQNRD